ncbi:MAG: hypothetical protein ACK5AZ_15790 [Bryobacteraceae bacterium]
MTKQLTALILFMVSLPAAAATINLTTPSVIVSAGQTFSVEVELTGNLDDEWLVAFGFDVLIDEPSRLSLVEVTVNADYFTPLLSIDNRVIAFSTALFEPVGSPIKLASLILLAGPALGPVTLQVSGSPADPELGLQIVNLSDFDSYAKSLQGSVTVTVTPEPGTSTMGLCGGLLLLAGSGWLRNRA